MTAGRIVAPRVDAATLDRLRAELREWQPLPVGLDSVCADLELVLDVYADPAAGDMSGLVGRLRGALGRLLPVARREQKSSERDVLNRAVLVWAASLPASAKQALAHVRRLALVTLDVLELLIKESPSMGASVTSVVSAPLNIRLCPPSQAYNYEFIRTRLADPHLVTRGFAVQVFRAPLLAVPVGGCCRGGFLIVEDRRIALAVIDLLWGQSGFPMLRLRRAPPPDDRYVVEWGENAPSASPEERGRFYGYAEDAIAHGRFELPPLPRPGAGEVSHSLSGRSRADPPRHRDQPERGLTSPRGGR
ncbi:DUF6302 family protein [Streptomyces sp. NPDC059396]|uniref:DUF6302 family protein n=1 Tax=Streptomyces sp. NPDC059396 TaxID=3346819 RepID=UPI0036C20448